MSTHEKPNKSSLPHTRAIEVARSKRLPAPPPAPAVAQRLEQLVHPATYAQMAAYQSLGLRQRLLTLPVMVALVLAMIWRQIGSVSELGRLLAQEGLLWIAPQQVSQQALSQRLLHFPAALFARVLEEVLPLMHARWQARLRPLPPEVAWAQPHFGRVLIFDGSTLDALWRKLGALRAEATTPLGGRRGVLLDLASRLPYQVFYEPEAQAQDLRWREGLLEQLRPHDLLVLDVGFLEYTLLDRLTERQVGFITRPKRNTVLQVLRIYHSSAAVCDQLVQVGCSSRSCCQHPLRLVEVAYQGQWYAYLTNVLSPTHLPAESVAALYRRRWRIEEAFALVKRLLGLAYLWVGSSNGVQLQVWATWLLYAVLMDLTDEVAHALDLGCEAVSVEMVFRGLYHFTQAYHRGEAEDPVCYLAQQARLLGIVKRKRRPKVASEATDGP